MIDDQTLRQLLPHCLTAARAAGQLISDALTGEKVIRSKLDGSPVTDTDEAAEDIIYSQIAGLLPDCGFVGEERVALYSLDGFDPYKPFWLVDALDGTRDFVRGLPDVTVNIALIEDQVPILGVVHAPMHNSLWWGLRGQGAFHSDQQIASGSPDRDRLRVVGGKRSSLRETMEPYLGPHVVETREQRSSSLKFCLLAQGLADVYPRIGDTYEWDTAAGHIILQEAGGRVIAMDTGEELIYGKSDTYLLNPSFIAGSAALFRGEKIRI